MAGGSLQEHRSDGVISRDLRVRDRRLEERELEVPELVPVEDVRVEVHPKPRDDVLHVLDGEFRVPSVVQMNRQRSEACAVGQVRRVAAVNTPAQADQAVVIFPLARRHHVVDHPVEALSAHLDIANE